jgi:hypothetical protein
MRLKVNEEKSGIRQLQPGALSRVPLSMSADRGGLANSRPAVGESGAAVENHDAGDDAPETAHHLHEGTQPISERMGGTLSAMHGRSHQGVAGSLMPTFAVASGRSSSARENDRVSYFSAPIDVFA